MAASSGAAAPSPTNPRSGRSTPAQRTDSNGQRERAKRRDGSAGSGKEKEGARAISSRTSNYQRSNDSTKEGRGNGGNGKRRSSSVGDSSTSTSTRASSRSGTSTPFTQNDKSPTIQPSQGMNNPRSLDGKPGNSSRSREGASQFETTAAKPPIQKPRELASTDTGLYTHPNHPSRRKPQDQSPSPSPRGSGAEVTPSPQDVAPSDPTTTTTSSDPSTKTVDSQCTEIPQQMPLSSSPSPPVEPPSSPNSPKQQLATPEAESLHPTPTAETAEETPNSSSGESTPSPASTPSPPRAHARTTSSPTGFANGRTHNHGYKLGSFEIRSYSSRTRGEVPWLRGCEKPGPSTLHEEIMTFFQFISPTPEELKMRNTVLSRVRSVILTLWPQADVKVFGSFATQSFLPTSDIDIVVLGAQSTHAQPIFALAEELFKIKGLAKLHVIPTAKVPVIKMTDIQTGCLVDISFNINTGPENTKLVKEHFEQHPLLLPLAIVIKFFLYIRGLNEPYRGGIGSFTLLLMIVSLIQQRTKLKETEQAEAKRRAAAGEIPAEVKEDDLGDLLLAFFEFYSRGLDYHNYGLSVRNGGSIFSKKERNWFDEENPDLLAMEDPSNCEIDVGRLAFAMADVRMAFDHAYLCLMDAVSRQPNAFRKTPIPEGEQATATEPYKSILRHIIWVEPWLEEQRKRIRTMFGDSSESTGDSALPTDFPSAHQHQSQQRHNPRRGGRDGREGREVGERSSSAPSLRGKDRDDLRDR